MRPIALLLLATFASFSVLSQVQTLTGDVYDEASRAPLPGVTVVVTDSHPVLGTVTDESGHFRIDSVPLGRRTIKVSYISYEEQVLHDIEVTAGKEVHLNISLQEAVRKLQEVTVTYDRSKDKNKAIDDMALVSARSFNVDETKLYAGSLGDPSRMAANYAGVIAGNDSRNDIVVRGNSPTGMLWQLEGMDIPNPNHFGTFNSTGGPVSMLNNNNIDKSDFLTGAFPAQYGDALAGVFDIRLRNGNMDKPEYVAQAGFNGFEGGAEGPIGDNKKTSYLVNYRYSTLQVFEDMGINLGTGKSVPVYQDLNYKVTTEIRKKSRLSLFGTAGKSDVTFLGKDVDTTNPGLYAGNPYQNEYTHFATTITGLSYDYQATERSSLRFIAGYCTTYQHYTSDSVSNMDASTYPNQYGNFQTEKISLQALYNHKFSAKDNIQCGITYESTSFSTLYKEMHPQQPDRIYEDQSGTLGLTQAYTQWKHRFSTNLSFVAGLHYQYLDINGSQAIEPRFAVRYRLNSRNSVSLGYGMHDQMQNVYTYYIQTPVAGGMDYTNKDLGFTRSQHLVVTYDLNITPDLRVKLESYYQYLDKVPATIAPSSYSSLNSGADFTLDNTDSLVNKGSGHNYGVELTVEHFLKHGFYFLVTGSLIDSKYKGSDGMERNTAFNTGHVLNVLLGKELKVGRHGSVLGFNLKVSEIGGKYLSPLNLAASDAAGTAVYDETRAYSLKQPDYFRTDLKLSYRRELHKSTMEFSIDLENITNHQNIFIQNYDQAANRIVNSYQQGFFPVPMFRYTF